MSTESILAIRQLEAEPAEPVVRSGFLTTEFWATAAVIVGNLVGVLSLLGLIAPGDIDTVGAQIKEAVLGLGALVVNGALVFKYISSRVQVKANANAEGTNRLAMHSQALTQRLQMQQEANLAQFRLNMQSAATGA